MPGDVVVLMVVGTVDADVDAVVGQVQGGEHDDAVAVEIQLNLAGQFFDFPVLFRDVAVQQHRSVPVGQPLAQPGFV